MERILKSGLFFLFTAIQVVWCNIYAGVPANYYDAVDKKLGRDAILSALTKTISSHTDVGYDGLYAVYAQSDVRADGKIWDIYSNCEFSVSDHGGNYKKMCDCYNREHTVPQSWFNEKSIIKSDAFHVYPTDGKVNGQRSNNPYGECEGGQCVDGDCQTERGRIGVSTFPGYTGKVFEPDDEFKGDLARTYFYMVACYRSSNFTSGQGNIVFSFTNNKTDLTEYAINLFMKWHRQDPVSEKEKTRNEAIYSFQKNRNPFIDYPCLAEYIWGEYQNMEVNVDELLSPYYPQFQTSDFTGCVSTVLSPTLFIPRDNTKLQIGKTNLNSKVTQTISVRGANLTEDLILEIEGTDRAFFSLSAYTLSPSLSNQGVDVIVTYSPTTNGEHTAQLIIRSKEFEQRNVILSGQCLSEITSPSPANDIVFYADEVGKASTHNITVRGTNLTGDVHVTISEQTPSSAYSITPNVISAQEAMAGKNVQLQYTPTELGNKQATLILSSAKNDFNDLRININAVCDFNVEVMQVGDSSALVSWNNAGVDAYDLDVFKIISEREEEDTIFVDACTNKDNISSSTGFVGIESNSIKMGSGTQLGGITYSQLNIEQGTKIMLTMSPYNQDANVMVRIQLGENTQIDTTLSSETKEYTFVATETCTSLSISTTSKKKRVFVKKVVITNPGKATEKEHVEGYPKRVTNTTQYKIEKLLPTQSYVISVTPIGFDMFGVETDFFIESEEPVPHPIADATLLAPTKDATIDMGKICVDAQKKAGVFVKSANLTDALHFRITGNDSIFFTLSSEVFYASRANYGDSLFITYHPHTAGTHQADLLIYSEELPTCTIPLTGLCLTTSSLSYITVDKGNNSILFNNVTFGSCISIYDGMGKKIVRDIIRTNTTSRQYILQHGVYVITIENKGQTQTTKVVL